MFFSTVKGGASKKHEGTILEPTIERGAKIGSQLLCTATCFVKNTFGYKFETPPLQVYLWDCV